MSASKTRRWLLITPVLMIAAVMGLAPSTTSAFTSTIVNPGNTLASNPYFGCQGVLSAYSQTSTFFEYALNETSGATYAADNSGVASRRGTYQGSMTSSSTPPLTCASATGGAYVLNGSSSYVTTATAVSNPTTFSLAVWFRTTVPSGLLIGFGDSQTGTSTQYDRMVYVDPSGKVAFTIYGSAPQTITSPKSYTDGSWHYAVSTFSPSGSSLYVDGAVVASDTTMSSTMNFTGYWRIGYGRLSYISGYGSVLGNLLGGLGSGLGLGGPTPSYFAGSLRYAAAFRSVLTPDEVKAQYLAGR